MRRIRVPLGATAAAALLLATAPGPVAALGQLQAADSAGDPSAPIVAAAALASWGLCAWLAATVLLTVAARLPGLTGSACAALSRRVAPAAVRRAVEVTLGLTVAVGVLGAAPASAAPGPAAATAASFAASTSSAAPARPELDWPAPSAPPAPASPPAPAPVVVPAQAGVDQPVVVRPGDSLWALATSQLKAAGTPAPSDAAVAQAWPSWWAANRDLVGDDPDLLRPGMQLSPPTAG